MKTKLYLALIFFFFSLKISFSNPAYTPLWTPTNGPAGCKIYSILFDGNKMFVATGYDGGYDQGGIFMSTNGGEQWISVNDLVFNKSVHCMTKVGETMYAGTKSYPWDEGGLYKSTNGGLNWVYTNLFYDSWFYTLTHLNSTFYLSASSYPVGCYNTNNLNNWVPNYQLPNLTFIEKANGLAYAGTSWGLYCSSNNGVNWVLTSLDSMRIENYAQKNDTIIVATPSKIFYSRNNFRTYDSLPNYNNFKINSILYDDGYLYTASDYDGVFRTPDFGKTWASLNAGLPGYEPFGKGVYTIAKNNGILYAGTMHYGLWKSTDDGITWSSQNKGLFTSAVTEFKEAGNYLVASVYSGNQLVRSNDNGSTWTNFVIPRDFRIKGFETINDTVYLFTEVIRDHTYYSSIYKSKVTESNWEQVGDYFFSAAESLKRKGKRFFLNKYSQNYLYYSDDYCETWTQSDIPPVYNIHAKNQSNDTLIATGYYNTTYLTFNGGSSWIDITSLSPYNVIFMSDICVHKNELYGASEGIYKFDFINKSWKPLNVTNVSIRAITSVGNYLIAQKSYPKFCKIFVSSNGGTTWDSTNYNINNRVFAGKFLQKNGYLFAASYGTGVWKMPISQLTGIKHINNTDNISFELFQNYPNPFNPTTKIKFSLPISSFAKLTIYDALGREVTKLIHQELSSGVYEVEWNASGFSSGVYYYVLSANNFIHSQKMLLIK